MRRTALLVLFAAACDRTPHAWEQNDADVPPPLPSPSSTSLVPPDPSANTAPSSAAPEETTHPPVRVGGPWVRCYGGFHASGDPVKDVTRLSLLCGPENGMHRLSKQPLEGTVTEGGAAVSEPLETKRGECYRVFAVAGSGVKDLDVTVRSSRGAPIAADHGEDAWPIVQPDRPFCPLEDDRATVEVSAKKGSGAFAAEVWVLKTAPKEPKRGVVGEP